MSSHTTPLTPFRNKPTPTLASFILSPEPFSPLPPPPPNNISSKALTPCLSTISVSLSSPPVAVLTSPLHIPTAPGAAQRKSGSNHSLTNALSKHSSCSSAVETGSKPCKTPALNRVSALIFLPESIAMRANEGPHSRTMYRAMVAGHNPRRTSDRQQKKLLLLFGEDGEGKEEEEAEARRISHTVSRPTPPPNAGPLSKAMVCLGQVSIVWKKRDNKRACKGTRVGEKRGSCVPSSASSWVVEGGDGADNPRSIPVQKYLPLPVMMTR